MNEELCIHELPVSQCATCAPDSPVDDDKPLLGPIFIAAYQSKCYHCGNDIEAGDHVGAVLGEEDEYAHYGCGR